MSERPIGQRTCLYQSAELQSVLDNMADQAAHYVKDRSRVVVVGILRRGVPLSEMLQSRLLEAYPALPLEMMQLKIKRYADDLTLLHPNTQLTEKPEQAALNLAGATVLVVDDVIYQGYSMLRAVEYLAQKQAAEIRTAILVDRGVKKIPITTDIVGVRLDVAPTNIIECNVPPFEPDFRIEVVQPIQGQR